MKAIAWIKVEGGSKNIAEGEYTMDFILEMEQKAKELGRAVHTAEDRDGGRSLITVAPGQVGYELWKARNLSGLGLREAARKAEMNPSQLSAIENGKTGCTSDTIHKLLYVYDVKVNFVKCD